MLVRIEGTMEGAKYRRILDENLLESAMNLNRWIKIQTQARQFKGTCTYLLAILTICHHDKLIY